MKKAMLLAFWGIFIAWGEVLAQSKVLICDAVSKAPIPYANVVKARLWLAMPSHNGFVAF